MPSDLDLSIDDMPEPQARARLGGRFAYAITLGAVYCASCASDAWKQSDLEKFAAYRTACRIACLIEWINDHDRPEPTLLNGDGTLTVATVTIDARGQRIIEYDVIPATMSAARELLGY